jgi:hypothetical protein
MALLNYPAVSVQSSEDLEYACERCGRTFEPPPTRISLRWWQARGPVIERQQALARINDDAFQAFLGTFKLCHRCREFVCPLCWSKAGGMCTTCATARAG